MNILKYILPLVITNIAFAQSYYPTDHTVTCGHTVKTKEKSIDVDVVKEHNVREFRFIAEGDNMYIVVIFEDKTSKSYLLADNDVCSVGNTK